MSSVPLDGTEDMFVMALASGSIAPEDCYSSRVALICQVISQRPTVSSNRAPIRRT
jgi:hypothetical protein